MGLGNCLSAPRSCLRMFFEFVDQSGNRWLDELILDGAQGGGFIGSFLFFWDRGITC
jgi:hypothetical protein